MSVPPETPEAARLRELLAGSGRSLREVAASAGVDASDLSEYLRGGKRGLRVATLARVLAALGATWADLDGGVSPPRP